MRKYLFITIFLFAPLVCFGQLKEAFNGENNSSIEFSEKKQKKSSNVFHLNKINQYPKTSQQIYYNLLRPLSFVESKEVVDQNPYLDLKENKEFQLLSNKYSNLFDNQFVPFKLNVSKEGFIVDVQVYYPLMSKSFPKSIEDKISSFLDNWTGIQLTPKGAIKDGKYVAYTAVMAFSVIDNQLILNPILH